MAQAERKIFVLTIKDTGSDEFDVYAEDAEQEVVRVKFVPNQLTLRQIFQLHGRRELGIIKFPDHELACSSIGEVLFQTFIINPKPVYDRYSKYKKRNKVRRIALQIPRSLYYLPWEVIRDPADKPRVFLSREGSVTRCDLDSQTLYDEWPQKSLYVFLMANTRDNPMVPFKPSGNKIVQFKIIDPATYANFVTRIKKWQSNVDGLVFFGHGAVYNDEGYINFVEHKNKPDPDPQTGFNVSRDIDTSSKMRIAYMLACESAWSDQKTRFEFSIAGSILLTTRLAFVVGAQTKIDFYAAKEFFEHTLQSLESGSPLDLAVTRGRNAVYKLSELDKQQKFSRKDWWVPVLYSKTLDFDTLRRLEADPLSSRISAEAPMETTTTLAAVGRKFQGLFSSDNEAVKELANNFRSLHG